MTKTKVAIRCLMCFDEAIGSEIASLPFPQLNLDGSFEAEQCLFYIFNVWTKAFCIRSGRYSSVGGESLIFSCPFTLTIRDSGLSTQACYLLLPRCEPCMLSCSAAGGQWAESTEADTCSPASNSLENCITWRPAKGRSNSDKRLAETTVVFSGGL